jgi:peptide/nickel transport system substrate-binding protein
VFNFTNDRLPGDGAVGTAVSQMLARIGVDVQANAQPGAVLFPARTRGDLSMVMSGWGTLTGEANYTLSSLVHSNAPQLKLGAFNWRAYNNPEMDKYLQAAAVEMDEGKRRAYRVPATGRRADCEGAPPDPARRGVVGLDIAQGQGPHGPHPGR